MQTIACFSVAAMDRFSADNSEHPGGNALNQAIRFRALGHQAAFIGGLGTDTAGDHIEALLNQHHVDISHVRRIPGITACNRIRNDTMGERFGEDGAWQNGAYGQFRMTQADWDFLSQCAYWSTHANGPDFTLALQKKRPDQFLAVDFLHLDDYRLLETSLPYMDIAYFGGTMAMADTLAKIAKASAKLIVLTLGAGGSIAFDGDKLYRQAALAVPRVIDTTGCGDAFQAACTAARLTGKAVPDCLAAGAAAGQSACQFRGALGDLT